MPVLHALTLGLCRSQTHRMAHIYMQFDFGKDEEKAQAARHKLETWKQAFRLDKKLLYKLARTEDATAAAVPAEKPEKAKGKSKSKGKEEPATPAENVKLLVRLAFSNHEKLSEERWVQRIPGEDAFQAAKPEVVKPGDANFAGVEKAFDELAG